MMTAIYSYCDLQVKQKIILLRLNLTSLEVTLNLHFCIVLNCYMTLSRCLPCLINVIKCNWVFVIQLERTQGTVIVTQSLSTKSMAILKNINNIFPERAADQSYITSFAQQQHIKY